MTAQLLRPLPSRPSFPLTFLFPFLFPFPFPPSFTLFYSRRLLCQLPRPPSCLPPALLSPCHRSAWLLPRLRSAPPLQRVVVSFFCCTSTPFHNSLLFDFKLRPSKLVCGWKTLRTHQPEVMNPRAIFELHKIRPPFYLIWLDGVFGYHVRPTSGRSSVRSSLESAILEDASFALLDQRGQRNHGRAFVRPAVLQQKHT